VNLKFTYRNRT